MPYLTLNDLFSLLQRVVPSMWLLHLLHRPGNGLKSQLLGTSSALWIQKLQGWAQKSELYQALQVIVVCAQV